MIPKIQIAGIKTEAEVDMCLSAGTDGIGLLQALDYPRDDALGPQQVKALADYARARNPLLISVLISHATDLDAISAAAKSSGVSTYQLHNDSAHELSIESIDRIRTMLGDKALIKVLHIPASGTVDDHLRNQARLLARHADALIFDSKAVETIDGRQYQTLGGTGTQNSWDIAKELVALVAPVPVIYAGGLNPGNVGAAIAHIRPYGVDVNSGTRRENSCDKDPAKISAFVENAKAAFASIS